MLAASTVVAGFFGYIYGLKRQSYLLLWAVGWTMFALHHLGPVLAMWRGGNAFQISLGPRFFSLGAGGFFFWGPPQPPPETPEPGPGGAGRGFVGCGRGH